jgi:spore coat protein CotH
VSLRWRRNWKLVAAFVAVLATVLVLFGGSRVSAITSSERADAKGAVNDDIPGSVALFDRSVVHRIDVTFDRKAYGRMVDSFRESGSKDFVEATVTIDGTRMTQVGLRLKGNSTLFRLRGPGGFGPPPPGGEDDASLEDPASLPWLIEVDQFVEGRRYEGFETLAVRPGGRITAATALNEALALDLVAAAGEPAVRSSYAAFSVNGSKPELRLVLEEPDKPFADSAFEHDGVLYKSLSTGSFTDMGDDPLVYSEAFRQITRKKQQDLRPLIDLIRWTAGSSDAEFAAQLGERVDVDSLARYAALHNLLLDFDDMAGPGQNYYLWYDLDTRRFTVVTWDLNFAFSGNTTQGPFERAGFGGGGPRGGPGPIAIRPGRFRGGFRPPRGGFGGPARGGHPLKDRALRVPAFRRLYERTYWRLYDELFAGGRALGALDALEERIAASGLVGEATLSAEVDRLRTTIEARTADLAAKRPG